MDRMQSLEEMKKHMILGKLFKKLSQKEYALCIEFIKENDHLDKFAFIAKANRWFLDQPKPTHLSDMWAIVTQL